MLKTLHQRVADRLSLDYWRRAGADALALMPEDLKLLRRRARKLRAHLDHVIRTADDRLALPAIGSTAMRRQPSTDWSLRPEAWRHDIAPMGLVGPPGRSEFGADLTLFHDSATAEIVLRQMRNRDRDDAAPYGLCLEVYAHDGSFLSLVVELPSDCVSTLRRNHILRVETSIRSERPVEVFARLNVRHGPNIEQLVREFDLARPDASVEFDLAYSKIDEKRIDKAWLDLIFENAALNQVMLKDLTISRRPRASI